MKTIVAVIGLSLLADLISRELSSDYKVVRQAGLTSSLPEAAKFIVVIYDEKIASDTASLDEKMRQTGVPWLRVLLSAEEGLIGPLVHPDQPGCCQCADNRRLTAEQKLLTISTLSHISESPREMPDSARTTYTALRHITYLLAGEVQKILQGEPACTEKYMYIVNLKTLHSSLHFVMPDPSCSVCGGLPEDSSEAAQISLSSRPKIKPGSYRSRSLDDMKQVLIRNYFDARTGMCNEKIHDLVSPFASVTVNLPSFMARSQVTAGRSHCYAESELTAILEALERHCGQTPLGKQTVVYDSFRHLADRALDPVQVGLYSQEQYMHPDFPFEAFDPERELDWVWGYSFLQRRPILVPEILAYYSTWSGYKFVEEGSNGCALGASIEEAIFYGILEVVERDAFLMTWYGQLSVPRLDLDSAHDEELKLMVEKLRLVAGYEVQLFNMTTENGIPSIWAIAQGIAPGKMNLICGAGAHLDPVRAAKNAIHEMAGMMCYLEEKLKERQQEIRLMLDNPFLVQEMEDHALLYGLPQAEPRLQFLLDPHRPLRKFHEEFKLRKYHPDLTDDLKEIMEVFFRLNLDIIVVNQTAPELMRNGLYCVKVLIPGMLPMTFGHHLTRISGLERLTRVPAELGYAAAPLKVDGLNPHPHPFI